MKLFLYMLMVTTYSTLLSGCSSTEQPEPLDAATEVMAEMCSSDGTLKRGMHATVHHRDGSSWVLIIEDSLRLAEFNSQWQPWPCAELPDSLHQEGLELIISCSDKTQWHNDTALYRLAELLEAKLISDFPLEDPRNSENMATLYVNKEDGTPISILSGVIFRNAQEWEQFLSSWPGAVASREVNFDTHTVLGQAVSHGGCGWRYQRSFEADGRDTLVYTVKASIYGGCQVQHRTYHWVTVPKVDEGCTVLFEFLEVVADDQ